MATRTLKSYRITAADGSDLGVWQDTDPDSAVRHAEWGRRSGKDESLAIPRQRLFGCRVTEVETGTVFARYSYACPDYSRTFRETRLAGEQVYGCDDAKGRVMGKSVTLTSAEYKLDAEGSRFLPIRDPSGEPAETFTLYFVGVFTLRDGSQYGAYPPSTEYWDETSARTAMSRKVTEARKRLAKRVS